MIKSLRLVRNYFDCFIGSFISKQKKGRYALGVLFVVLIGTLMITIFANSSYLTTVEFNKNGVPILAMYMNCSMALMMVLILTVMRSALPQKTTDEEFLLALPISKPQIIFAKSFFNYLFDLISLIGILFPSFIIYYYIVDGAQFLIIINGLVIILLIPFFSNALASIISIIFQKIASISRNYSLVQTLLILVLLILFLVFNYGIKGILDNHVNDLDTLLNRFLPMKWLMTFILDNNLLSLLWIVLICIPIFIVSILLKAYYFGKTLKSYQSKKTTLNFKEQKPWVALYIKELKNYFSLPIYIVNTIFGVIIYFALAILIGSINIERISFFILSLQLPGLIDYTAPIIIGMLCLGIATVATTAPSISLEGKNIWILKAHPVLLKDVYVSKILVNLTLTIIPIMIGSPLVASTIGWEYLGMTFVLPLLTSVIIAIYGLFFNLLFPKMDWESEVVPIKQSLSVLIILFFGLIIVGLPFTLTFIFLQRHLISFLVLINIYLFVILLGIRLLMTKGKKCFEQL